jgi:hypothetical protein
MRAILAQTSDLDDAVDGFGKKPVASWTDEEKRKGRKAFVVSSDSDGDALAVFVACVSRDNEWILDTAASFHICCNKDWFSSYEFVQSGDFVCVWEMILRVRLSALALLRSRHMMG